MVGGQGGCERIIEDFMKIQKKIGGCRGGGGRGEGSGWGVRVDVNEELKFLEKFTNKILGGGGREGDQVGVRVGRGSVWM